MSSHTERAFETAIEAGLTSFGGYEKRNAGAYDEALALFPSDVTDFLRKSQPAKWERLEALLGAKTATTVLDTLSKELGLKGTLHVLRHGFKCQGKTFRMAYFRPNTRMNPDAAQNYARNRLTITRQVGFTSVMKTPDGKNRRCIIDVTLAVNGIPVVTAELKNPLTGQRVAHAISQYENERDERDLLFAFKKRALVHFAVDTDEVWMTTRLQGKDTDFLPFNRGNNHGAGQRAGRGQLEDRLPVGRGATGRQPPGNPAALHAPRREGKEGQDQQGRAHRAEGDHDLPALPPAGLGAEARRATRRPTVPGGNT